MTALLTKIQCIKCNRISVEYRETTLRMLLEEDCRYCKETNNMTNTIDTIKKDYITKLEALQKVASELDGLKVRLSDINLDDVLLTFVTNEVNKVNALAKKHKIDFSVDPKELIGLVGKPEPKIVRVDSIPFTPSKYSSLTDDEGREWEYSDGEWHVTWEPSTEWDSSSANC